MSKNYPAPLKCIEAVEAAVTKKSFDDGLKAERAGFSTLITSDEHRALRHVFFGERAAAKIADVPEDTPVRAGEERRPSSAPAPWAPASAINFLNAGIPVTILETKADALDRGVAAVRKVYEDRVKKGKMKQDKAEATLALLKPTLSYDDLRGRRPRHRGGVRGHRRQGSGVPQARRSVQAGRDPREQHVDARPQPDRRVHQAAAGCRRPALLQPGQRDEAARSRPRREDRAPTCWRP